MTTDSLLSEFRLTSPKGAQPLKPAIMKRTNLHLPEPMRERLHALAERTGQTAAEHVRKAIAAYLKKQEGKS